MSYFGARPSHWIRRCEIVLEGGQTQSVTARIVLEYGDWGHPHRKLVSDSLSQLPVRQLAPLTGTDTRTWNIQQILQLVSKTFTYIVIYCNKFKRILKLYSFFPMYKNQRQCLLVTSIIFMCTTKKRYHKSWQCSSKNNQTVDVHLLSANSEWFTIKP